MRNTNATVKRMKDSIAKFDQDIAEARQKASRDVQAEQEPIRARLAEIDDDVARAGHEHIKCRASHEDAEEARRANVDKLTNMRDQINLAKEGEVNARRKITALEGARKDSLLSFGDTMPSILRAIQAETGWQKRPVGPIGQHVKLANQYRGYAGVLESFFSDTLNAFLVDNERDKQILNRILRQNRPK